jgi:hypothetical protein
MLSVHFHEDAQRQLEEFLPCLEFYKDIDEYKQAVTEILTQDPRATHYKKGVKRLIFVRLFILCIILFCFAFSHFPGTYMELYGFCLDYLNILSKFDDENRSVTVMKIENFKERFVREKREQDEKQMDIDNVQYNSKLNDKLGRKIRHKKKKLDDSNSNSAITNTNDNSNLIEIEAIDSESIFSDKTDS